MSVLIKGMEMPKDGTVIAIYKLNGQFYASMHGTELCPLVPVTPHGILSKRLVYRGEVYNALEAERVNSLDGILADPYKDGFHDGLKRALQILAEVEDAPTIIEAEEGE